MEESLRHNIKQKNIYWYLGNSLFLDLDAG